MRPASFRARQNYKRENPTQVQPKHGEGKLACTVALETITLSNVLGYSATLVVVGELQPDSRSCICV